MMNQVDEQGKMRFNINLALEIKKDQDESEISLIYS
jgi:hypothetical protein